MDLTRMTIVSRAHVPRYLVQEQKIAVGCPYTRRSLAHTLYKLCLLTA